MQSSLLALPNASNIVPGDIHHIYFTIYDFTHFDAFQDRFSSKISMFLKVNDSVLGYFCVFSVISLLEQ